MGNISITLKNQTPSNKLAVGILAVFSSYIYVKFVHMWILSRISIKLNTYSSYYKKCFRPKRIILVRHGESEGNVDKTLYAKIPDNKINLTKEGLDQATEAGQKIAKILDKNSKIKFFVSPYNRTKQTYEQIHKVFLNNNFKCDYVEEPSIREQEWGNFQDEDYDKMQVQRHSVGRFYYRFKTGESGADAYDRASRFLDTLFRNMDNYKREKYDTYVIVSHGLFIRLFLMRFFRLTVEQFENFRNLNNCEFISLIKDDDFKYVIEESVNNSFKVK
jgi:broad specificity phosphatase PhoE